MRGAQRSLGIGTGGGGAGIRGHECTSETDGPPGVLGDGESDQAYEAQVDVMLGKLKYPAGTRCADMTSHAGRGQLRKRTEARDSIRVGEGRGSRGLGGVETPPSTATAQPAKSKLSPGSRSICGRPRMAIHGGSPSLLKIDCKSPPPPPRPQNI